MATAGTLKGVLTLDQAQYVAGLKDASKTIGKFSTDTKKAGEHTKEFEAHMLNSRAAVSTFAAVTGVSAGEVRHFGHAIELLGAYVGPVVGAFLLFKSAMETVSEAGKKHAEQIAEDTRKQEEYFKAIQKTNIELGLTPKSSGHASALKGEIDTANKRIAELSARKKEMNTSGKAYDASGALKFSKADQSEIDRLQEQVQRNNDRIAALHDDKFLEFKKSMKKLGSDEFTQKLGADSNDPIKNLQDENKLLEEKANLIKDALRLSLNDKERHEELDSQLESVMLKQKEITDEIKKQGREITNSVNPMEKFKEETEQLKELMEAGAIDQNTFNKKNAQNRNKMYQEQDSLSGSAGAPVFSHAVKMSELAVQKMDHQRVDTAQAQLEETKNQTDVLTQILEATKTGAPAVAQ